MKIDMKGFGEGGDTTLVYLTTDDDVKVKAKLVKSIELTDHIYNLMSNHEITSVNTDK